ncbi:hypothetical protein HanIR_Chr09g0393791 [Helianthus annuus]|nr:hypothetical protein HanIR_Chr09g0393791 [Helianthus annuus]
MLRPICTGTLLYKKKKKETEEYPLKVFFNSIPARLAASVRAFLHPPISSFFSFLEKRKTFSVLTNHFSEQIQIH